MLIVVVSTYVLGSTCNMPDRRSAPSSTREDDSIIVCGQPFHTGSRVVLWHDSGGFNGYLKRSFRKPNVVLPTHPAPGCNTPERYGVRACFLDEQSQPTKPSARAERQLIERNVDRIVMHYDAAGTSSRCFEILHDDRGLSAHFLVDLDGVIYQTLDVRERARHAGTSNDRSVGVEIANVGAYRSLEELRAAIGRVDAAGYGTAYRRLLDEGPVTGTIQGQELYQYRFTDAQYIALANLTRALGEALPRLRPVFPTEAGGEVRSTTLSERDITSFKGIVGHWHVATHKVDPGPSFDWHRLIRELNRGGSDPIGSGRSSSVDGIDVGR